MTCLVISGKYDRDVLFDIIVTWGMGLARPRIYIVALVTTVDHCHFNKNHCLLGPKNHEIKMKPMFSNALIAVLEGLPLKIKYSKYTANTSTSYNSENKGLESNQIYVAIYSPYSLCILGHWKIPDSSEYL